ncbi:hypothetical protein [Pedobacter sp. UBA4863]|nr:hypothetical protein [Pedobacter sp. UBA4863]
MASNKVQSNSNSFIEVTRSMGDEKENHRSSLMPNCKAIHNQ